jgi:DNA-binding beta-propeller fold protein YncE
VDADSRSKSVLVPAGTSLRFFPSPDGQQIALLSTTELSFMKTDGGDWRQAVFAYPATGVPGRIIPGGVWTQDASAFVIAAPAESASEFVSNIVIWRVPVDGSPAQSLAAIGDSSHDSLTFSPDGRSVAYFRADSPAIATHYGWFVAPLSPETGPLAVPGSAYLFAKNLHWSPAGLPYAIHDGALDQLCPDPAQDVEVCSPGSVLAEQLAEISWIDGTHFLFVTREPYDLYFGRLDGTQVRISEGVERFAATMLECENDADFTAGGEGPADFSVAADSMFPRTWRLRNTGTCAWDSSYRLAFLDGERLSGPHSLPLEETVPPGGEIELSVNLLAPADPGTYQGEWQLTDPGGAPFGVRLPVAVNVSSVAVTEFRPDQIVAKIPVGGGPIALGEGALWLLSGQDVSRIDLETNQVVETIPVGEFPTALAIGFGAVWAAANGTVYRIDPLTNQVSATIPIDPTIGLHCLETGAGSVWACNGEAGLVYRIDPDTNQISATIQVEPGPSQVAPLEDAVWLINPEGLRKIDPDSNELSPPIKLDCAARRLFVDAAAVWVPCQGTPALYRIDPQTSQLLARIGVGPHPFGVASGANAVWVTSVTGNTLTRIDPATNQVSAVYPVGENPGHLIANQGELFVTSQGAIWRIRP